MPNHQQLDNVKHKNIRIITEQHPSITPQASYARLMLSELKYAQSEYPIFLRKSVDSGQFELIAMLGLEKAENLFLDQDGWHAHYLPLTIQKDPFLIGFQQDLSSGTAEDKAVVHIDMDSPRISEVEGEVLFLPQGGQSPYLQHVSSVLGEIHGNYQAIPDFINSLINHELVEAFDLSVNLNNDQQQKISGLYCIHEENLRALDSDALNTLHKAGYLEMIYMMIASIGNISKLVELKNLREEGL